MSITSFNFFVFVVATLIIYFFCVPKKVQWCALLAASYVFYFFAGGRILFIYILFTTTTVYWCGLWIERLRDRGAGMKAGKWIITLALLGNFGLLAFFKWYNTAVGFANNLLGDAFQLPLNNLLLPLGISFYTFQAIGYLIDMYRGSLKPERNWARFALFLSFFPQLIQGPISRHSELADQLYASHKFDYIQARRGFQLIIWGLFKKLVIADRLFIMTTTIYDAPDQYKGLYVLLGAALVAIRVYTDFSGGVDVARGVAQMLGINLPQNFRRPFFAENVREYWRRWHITLNGWWRDYLFYPFVLSKPMAKLGKFTRRHISKRLGKIIAVYIGITIVRLVNAMWHGAESYYIANGLYFGILMVLGLIFRPKFAKVTKMLRINTERFFWKLFQITRTFLVVILSRVFILMGGIWAGMKALISIVADFNPGVMKVDTLFSLGLSQWDVWILMISLALVLVVDILQEKGIAIRETLERQKIAVQWAALLTGIFLVLLWGRYGFGYDAVRFVYEEI